MATQIYEKHLVPTELTIGQFGVLAQLYGVSVQRETISMKGLAALVGMDPTTLNRTLKPLEQGKLVSSCDDPSDRRARLVTLTTEGEVKLTKATPLWQAAQRELREAVGNETTIALNGLLDLVGHRLQD